WSSSFSRSIVAAGCFVCRASGQTFEKPIANLVPSFAQKWKLCASFCEAMRHYEREWRKLPEAGGAQSTKWKVSITHEWEWRSTATKACRRSYPGGYFSYFGIAGSIWSHGCASEVKMSYCGRNQLGSSKLPALIPTISDVPWRFSPPVNREPHSAQKPRLCRAR